MAQRTCTMPDCNRPHRARGWCITHYNREHYTDEQRHPKHRVECVVCGTAVVRRTDSKYATTCSVACRTIVQWGKRTAPTSQYAWRYDVLKRVRDHGCTVVEVFDRDEIFERDAWTCYLCGIGCTEPDPYVVSAATIDHVIPLHLFGEHSRANVKTACLSCNAGKQANLTAA